MISSFIRMLVLLLIVPLHAYSMIHTMCISDTMVLRPNGVPGPLTITVTVDRYRQEYLDTAKYSGSVRILSQGFSW